MSRTKQLLGALQSPIGKKLITGITGLALTGFVIAHMAGNLSYFSDDPQAYNKYGHFLLSLGVLFYLIEIALLLFFVFHIVTGIQIWLGKRKARGVNYERYKSAGKPSLQSLSSRSMIITGLILLVFLVVHLWSFKYGPGIEEGYVVNIEGEQVRDLKTLLEEKFSHASYAFGYPLVMLLLAFHLRHGIWSALQSLGAMRPRLTPVVYTLGGLIGLGIALGFLVLPLYIFFTQ